MTDPTANRAAAIRDYLARMDADPALARRYSLVAARWEQLRLARNQGRTTPSDDARFRELSQILKALTEQLRLPTCTDAVGEAIPALTDHRGFLPRDPQRILHGETWQSAAEGW